VRVRVREVTGYEGLILTVSIWRGKVEDETKSRNCEEFLLPLLRYEDDLVRRR
jgi:hypothetical protein